MPKKFANENPKVVAARDRKATAKREEAEKKQKAAEDAYWADDDKLVNRKLQRKEEEERKKLEALKRKEENRKLAEEEMSSLSKKTESAPKVTRAAIHQRKEQEERIMKELEERRQAEAQKIEETLFLKKWKSEMRNFQTVTELEENINRLDIEAASARNVDEALKALGDAKAASEIDKHPEKRLKAAYLAFEEKRLPQLKIEHPTYRLSQLKQVLKKEWQKSPENPLNAKIMALSQ
ncbi:unnamed protein product [Caenorhabditis bovis]|uniref:Coiled-coil domain-containing protein n=1 Tax=Caenorhabditis bovis TaxID=2654633 RepID=A0A8S1F8H8_9PELO|nr:unnamed protein product [Caenorhabditis bovis]